MGSLAHFFSSIFGSNPNEGKLKFRVTGTADKYDITYKCQTDRALQLPGATRGWKRSQKVKLGDYVYLSAQGNKKDSEVNVEIHFKGKTFRQASSKGDYPVAVVSGYLE